MALKAHHRAKNETVLNSDTTQFKRLSFSFALFLSVKVFAHCLVTPQATRPHIYFEHVFLFAQYLSAASSSS